MLRVSYLKFSVAKAKSDHSTRTAKVHKVRIADIHVFSREGPVWVLLLFKQRFIDVHCYQLCQAEELL
jgi:hypothetical protein